MAARWRKLVGCLLPCVFAACAAEPAPPRGVVLVLLDTLRADRLGCYGYDRRPTSPNLDRLADEAVLFEMAISHAPWTLASMASIFSGFPDDRAFEGELQRSLVQDLSAAGVRTAAFTEGGFFTDAFGMGLGFDEFHEDHYLFDGGIERTFEAALDWLDANGDVPFFLVVHTYEAHMPYLRTTFTADTEAGRIGEHFTQEDHEAVSSGDVVYGAGELEHLEALYDGGVRACDDWVGRLFEGLEQRGLHDATAVIITSDHGEELAEQRFPSFAGDHGHAFYDYLLRVPLIIADPRERVGRRVAAQVRSMDILPTAMEMLGVDVPDDVHGRSLLPLVAGDTENIERLATGQNPEKGPPRDFVRAGGHKLIVLEEEPGIDTPFAHLPTVRLFNLETDPREERNVAGEHPTLVEALRRVIGREEATDGIDFGELDVPPELEEQLRALGYGGDG